MGDPMSLINLDPATAAGRLQTILRTSFLQYYLADADKSATTRATDKFLNVAFIRDTAENLLQVLERTEDTDSGLLSCVKKIVESSKEHAARLAQRARSFEDAETSQDDRKIFDRRAEFSQRMQHRGFDSYRPGRYHSPPRHPSPSRFGRYDRYRPRDRSYSPRRRVRSRSRSPAPSPSPLPASTPEPAPEWLKNAPPVYEPSSNWYRTDGPRDLSRETRRLAEASAAAQANRVAAYERAIKHQLGLPTGASGNPPSGRERYRSRTPQRGRPLDRDQPRGSAQERPYSRSYSRRRPTGPGFPTSLGHPRGSVQERPYSRSYSRRRPTGPGLSATLGSHIVEAPPTAHARPDEQSHSRLQTPRQPYTPAQNPESSTQAQRGGRGRGGRDHGWGNRRRTGKSQRDRREQYDHYAPN